MSEPNTRVLKFLRMYCDGTAIAVVALGCLVLWGWAFHIETVKTVFPGFVTMKANTALGLAFSGISSWLLMRARSSSKRWGLAGHFLALLVVLLGATTLGEYFFGLNLRVDEFLFRDPSGSLGTTSPGRMAPTTAMAFLAIGLALMLLDYETRRERRPSQVLSLGAALISMLAVNGYIYHATALYRILVYTQVAIHTAIALFLLSAAVFFARPTTGITRDLTSQGSGSIMARRFLPAVFLILIFLGWIRLQGQRAGLYGTELGLALFATSSVVVFAILIWLSARQMNREYDQRKTAETGILKLNAGLEERVAERTQALEQQTVVLAQQAALLDLAHDAIIVRDMKNRILFWNHGAEIVYGWPAEIAVGKFLYELLKSELPQPLEEIEPQLLKHGHWEGEVIHYRQDGVRLIVSTRWALQRNAEGMPHQILAINHDITGRKQAEAKLHSLTERQLLANSVARVGVWEWDLASDTVICDNTMLEIYGFLPVVPLAPGQSFAPTQFARFAAAIHPEDLPEVNAKLQRVIAEKGQGAAEFRISLPDGTARNISAVERAVVDEHGNVTSLIGVNMDVTDRNEAKEALFAEKERAQVTLDSIGDAVISTDISGNVTFLNLVAEKMTGWSREEATGRHTNEILQILDADSRERTENPMEIALRQDRTVHLPLNCILIRRDGSEIPIEDSVAPIHDRQGQASGAVIVFRDVSAARAMTLQITHSARHDILTGLPNRALVNDRINQAIALAPRHLKKVAVLFVDLDGFKHINDSLGHAIGDRLLQSVTRRLVACVRGSDTVSRQGGDEFVVLLSEVEHAEDAAITATRMLQTVAEAHPIGEHDLHVTASIGLSIFPDDGRDAETLIKNADTAMYQAKENGRQSYQFFKQAMNVRAVERQSIEGNLRRALERHEISLHYQPKINLKTGEISGAEALIRWTHSTDGPISPARFIPIAEDCGLILPIGNWVLREACRQARAWLDAGLPLLTMGVNISAMEFRSEPFLNGVFEILSDTGLDPRILELELTESVLMKRPESTESILKTLRARGVQVAVDDFGTGYSSLSYLRKFPIDALKIDQSFVRQITTTPDDTAIVTAVISMGRSLKLRVVAEGVETPEELAFLQAHQCDEAQGYFFSRPVIAQEFAKLLKTGVSTAVLQ
jgi:diguanylate cyclase (GGDEF)-like protein/PAS domain S-box-containing protein